MSNRTPIKINAGKTAENSMPLFKPSWSAVRFGKDAAIFALPETAPLTAPINAGPTEQPTSPNTAKMPNIAVPPFGYAAEVSENVPGHMRLTEKPHSAHFKLEEWRCNDGQDVPVLRSPYPIFDTGLLIQRMLED